MSTSPIQPPRLAAWLARLCVHEVDADVVLGDLEETYRALHRHYGPAAARRWYRSQVFRSFPPFIHRTLFWSFVMLKNYAKIALRNLRRDKGYAFINVFGLAVGIACCLLIVLYVQDELSYDRFHEKTDRIYRATYAITSAGETLHVPGTPSAVAPTLRRAFPEIEEAVRFFNSRSYGPSLLRRGDQGFLEEHLYYADSSVFNIFSFPFLAGDPKTALVRPNTMVLTRSMAQKYFGTENPLGQTLTVSNWVTQDFEITGLIEDVPANAHFRFDFLASYRSLTQPFFANDVWYAGGLQTFFLLRDAQAAQAVEEKIPALIDQEIGELLRARNESRVIHLQPLADIHLYSHLEGETNGNIVYVYLFSVIAAFILLLACINYMNLATARSARRAREVGMRKVLGAHRIQLVKQFFGESVLTTILALMIAFGLVYAALPAFNDLAGKHLTLHRLFDASTLLSLLSIGLLVSLIAGSYPALFLSTVQPIRVLKGMLTKGRRGSWLRQSLVVFQFAVSVILVVGTLVVSTQLEYLRNKKLGFDKEQVLILPIGDPALREQYATLKASLLTHTNVLSVSATSGFPGSAFGSYRIPAEGLSEDEYPGMLTWPVDEDIFQTLGLELLTGPGFPETRSPDQGITYVLNESALQRLGWSQEEALGKWLVLPDTMGTVVGVVKDFNFVSLHTPIEPLVLYVAPRYARYLSTHLLVKVKPKDIEQTLAFAQATWVTIAPHRPFQYSFLNQEFDAQYRFEQHVGQVFRVFAGLAVFIACLGLLGLTSFMTEQRTKEIGIRKILGATVANIVLLLTRDFIRLVLLGIVLAAPIAYLAMHRWLGTFAYRIEISWSIIGLAGLIALLMAASTVSYQAIRGALANPVDSLRYE